MYVTTISNKREATNMKESKEGNMRGLQGRKEEEIM